MADTSPEKEELLPLPSKDLPLPEKELPANVQSGNFLSSKWVRIAIVAVIIAIAVSGAYFLGKYNVNQQIACTQEAKLCPDGSYVGRTGPKCEFASCPAAKADETANWKTYIAESFSFKYPSDWSTKPCPFGDNCEYNDPETWPSYQKIYPTLENPKMPIGVSVEELNFMASYHGDEKNTITEDEFYDVNGLMWRTGVYGGGISRTYDKPQLIFPGKVRFIKQTYKPTLGQGDSYENQHIDYESTTYSYAILLNPQRYLSFDFVIQDANANKSNIIEDFERILSTFKFNDQTSPTPTCTPRPACLDATPKCLIPETSDMCPATATPSP